MPAPVFQDRRIMVVRSLHPVERRGSGWLAFAATMLFAAAWVNLIWGILAIGHDAYWNGDPYVLTNTSLFGWIFILIAPVQVTAALLLWADSAFGAVLGLLVVLWSAFLHICALPVHPVASAAVLAIDALVAYALLAYGLGRRRAVA
jgi:hypothetical protein